MNMDRWIDKINESHATIDYADYSELMDLVVELKAENESLKNSKRMPITKFNSNEELQACIEWWQAKLGLQDWIIKGKSTNDLQDIGNHGENSFNVVGKHSMIRIRPYDSVEAGEWIARQPQELVLVHELLHCLIYEIEKDTESIELIIYNLQQHQLIESMAKALIMAKYDIGLDYFRNF